MAEPAHENVTPISSTNQSSSNSSDEPLHEIQQRRSNELIVALCGAIGSGVRGLRDILTEQLSQKGYVVEHIRLSSLIIEQQEDSIQESLSSLSGFDRYSQLQDLGDELRDIHRTSILAELAIQEIASKRKYLRGEKVNDSGSGDSSERIAYLIDQVKHPREIELFREVYRNNFYLVGLLRNEGERKNNLSAELMDDQQIAELINRDRKASEAHGQHVEKSLHQADYFIRNIDDTGGLRGSVERFIHLIHGTNHITPTIDETGMYSAYSASLRSACLSRQVGAVIMDDSGKLLSTGCNDVPKYGGGLYDVHSSSDKRCFNYGRQCHNDKHKQILKSEILGILNRASISNSEALANDILENTKAKSLIEYSRAIHAEMDAITGLARSSNNSSEQKVMYCTTYPCHVCARHIVAAGIKKVVYIEPYEKSLALQLHGDAIAHPENSSSDDKVLFVNFEGVAPLRYARFFGYGQKRKNAQGDVITYSILDAGHVDPQYLESYPEYELKVVQKLNQTLDNT